MELTQVLYEVRDRVATITLNRPEQRNALTSEMLGELRSALGRARADTEVRAAVLTGAGDKAFCAGADLSGFEPGQSEVDRHIERGGFVETFLLMERLGKPIVAGVNGHALAGGFGLMLACDLAVCADAATLGTTEIRVGLWPMMIMAIVNRHLPRKRALELYMTGKRISPEQALEWGLVNEVVAAGEVRDRAQALAAELAQKSPLIMSLGRDAFYAIDGLDTEAALRHLHAQLTVVSLSDDAREGVLAFFEKREPRFTGR